MTPLLAYKRLNVNHLGLWQAVNSIVLFISGECEVGAENTDSFREYIGEEEYLEFVESYGEIEG